MTTQKNKQTPAGPGPTLESVYGDIVTLAIAQSSAGDDDLPQAIHHIAEELYHRALVVATNRAIEGIQDFAFEHGAAYISAVRPEDFDDDSFVTAWPVLYDAAFQKLDLDTMDHESDPRLKAWFRVDRSHSSLVALEHLSDEKGATGTNHVYTYVAQPRSSS